MDNIENWEEVATMRREDFTNEGQGHVFNGWDELSEQQQKELLTQTEQFDVSQVNQLFEELIANAEGQEAVEEGAADFEAIEADQVMSKLGMDEDDRARLSELGLEKIREGKACVILMAGGQGTRLGSSKPKGMYNIGLPSGKSIFQLLAEKFFRAQLLAHGLTAGTNEGRIVVPEEAETCKMLVMCTHENYHDTKAFFAQNNYFGGQESSFLFFKQRMLPAVSTEGKIYMKSKGEIALAPNGNGALLDAIAINKTVKEFLSSVDYAQIIGVDNVLNKVLDPVHLGFTIDRDLECSLKSCEKRDAGEKVGVIGKKDGKYSIIEYSELSDQTRYEKEEDGKTLKYRLGHILVFCCSTPFLLERASASLDDMASIYHKAAKKIQHVDPETFKTAVVTKENGWKFELFLHDLLPYIESEKLGILVVDRKTEFAPVKNADTATEDTPTIARTMLMAESGEWIRKQKGTHVQIGSSPYPISGIEVSSLLSYEGEGLESLNEVDLKGVSGYIDHDFKFCKVEKDGGCCSCTIF